MCEKNGDSMHKLKRAAAVAAMVGGISLVGGGVASAGGYDDPYPVIIGNLQKVDCEQAFEGGGPLLDTGGGALTGDTEVVQANACTVAGSIED